MDLYYLPEILFYELVDLFPNLILLLIPFRTSLRLSGFKTVLFVLIIYFSVAFCRLAAISNTTAAAVFSVVWIVLYLSFCALTIKTQPTKLLFVLLILLNYGNYVSITFSYFCFHRFPSMSSKPYSFYSTLCLAGTTLVGYPIIYKIVKYKLKPLLLSSINNKYWRFLWLVPATFCLSYYYNLFSNGGIIAFSTRPGNVIFAILFNLDAVFVTYLLLKLLEESNTNFILRSDNNQLSMQFLQYKYLQNRMEETRRAKHDLHQNLTIMQSYLKDGDQDGLLAYISNYISSLPADSPIIYCEDYTLNALLVYYENIAREKGISFQAKIEYPSNIGIKDHDTAVLFGNLLENAVEAGCRQNQGEAKITFCINKINDIFIATLDNTYEEKIVRSGEDFISTKSGCAGIGTASARRIAAKYNGIIKFNYDEKLFHASVLLCPKAD